MFCGILKKEKCAVRERNVTQNNIINIFKKKIRKKIMKKKNKETFSWCSRKMDFFQSTLPHFFSCSFHGPKCVFKKTKSRFKNEIGIK